MSEVSSSQAEGLSSQTFVTALVTNASILGIELAAFIFLKHRLSRIYEPRAYLPPPEYAFIFTLSLSFRLRIIYITLPRKRAIDLPPGPWKWLLAIFAVPTSDVVRSMIFLAFSPLHLLSSSTRMAWMPTCSFASSDCSSSCSPP